MAAWDDPALILEIITKFRFVLAIFVICELSLDVLAMDNDPDLFLEIAVNFRLVCAEFEIFQVAFQPQLCFEKLSKVSSLLGLSCMFVEL